MAGFGCPPRKKSRFSEEKMVKILRETDKIPVTQLAKKHGVSEQTTDSPSWSRSADGPPRTSRSDPESE
jgi:hypothetical protein